MRARAGAAALLLLLVLTPALLPAQTAFVWGVVKWGSGNPASGLTVKLVQGQSERATAYTNPAGKYAFFNQAGAPANYTLRVLDGARLLKEVSLGQVPAGGQVPDIVVN